MLDYSLFVSVHGSIHCTKVKGSNPVEARFFFKLVAQNSFLSHKIHINEWSLNNLQSSQIKACAPDPRMLICSSVGNLSVACWPTVG